jgi:hypothetical protein
MAIVIVKNKYQVIIPRRVREQIGVAIGDVLEARAQNFREDNVYIRTILFLSAKHLFAAADRMPARLRYGSGSGLLPLAIWRGISGILGVSSVGRISASRADA